MGGKREAAITVYADISDIPIDSEGWEVEQRVVDRSYLDPELLTATDFAEESYSYDEYTVLRYENQDVLAAYDIALPEIYGLAEQFVRQYPVDAILSDVLERKQRRRLRRTFDRELDADTGDVELHAAIDDVLDDFELADAIDMSAFRDRLTVTVFSVYNIPVTEE